MIPRVCADFHNSHGKSATLTSVLQPGRWGSLTIEGENIKDFKEKPIGDEGWINGGFFVLEPNVLDLIDDDKCVWEKEPLKKLANEKQLKCYKHSGFWRPMDTLRDKNILEELWLNGDAPWKIWS